MHRVLGHLDEKTWDVLMDLNCRQELRDERFTLSKFEATGFLNAPVAVKKLAIEKIADESLVSQKAVDEFCVNQVLEPTVLEAAAKHKLDENEIEEVCILSSAPSASSQLVHHLLTPYIYS